MYICLTFDRSWVWQVMYVSPSRTVEEQSCMVPVCPGDAVVGSPVWEVPWCPLFVVWSTVECGCVLVDG